MARRKQNVNKAREGMAVEATKGDLGEQDISKPTVDEVIRDADQQVTGLVIEKGAVFKKKIEIPADRIQKVEPAHGEKPGKVVFDGEEKELEALKEHQTDELATEKEMRRERKQDILNQVEEKLPTAEGLRKKEAAPKAKSEQSQSVPSGPAFWLRMLGPGFLAGMAGNDSSAIAAYAIDGAQAGFGHLWLMLLSTPLYQAVQFACAKLGRVTQRGLADILREHFGYKVALPAALVLLIANIALITADLVAISSGLELLTHIAWPWFVVPVAIILWYLVVFSNFKLIKKIFIGLSLAFVAYLITGILARPAWGQVLFNTFVPHLNLDFASVSSAVALLGATISPYNIFWQVQGEKEEKRPGTQKQKLRFAALDIAVGVISGNLVAYFIILSTAATLFKNHKTITTASDAAQALTPILGPFGEYLFALGLIGAGVVAIPVLLASTSYAVAGTIGWPAGLSKKPWQNEGFYLIISAALVLSMVLALLHLNPIQLLFWANVLNGVLAPILVIYVFVLGNSQRVMRGQRLGIATNIGLVVTVIVMVAAAIMLFYGLLGGQS
ncbi:MAG TPA: divalent metal cation transporter [Ktedonobacteraceae bacterium]|nr:divalent metal cation transporter [Ktedonobacteraceae bacterium]